jgi:hypothetical protein
MLMRTVCGVAGGGIKKGKGSSKQSILPLLLMQQSQAKSQPSSELAALRMEVAQLREQLAKK